MQYAASALFTSTLILGTGGAAAQMPDSIGSAIQVVNLVTAELARETRSLKIGDGVRQNEIIEVGSDGSSEFKLKDETKLALGPGSRLVLDKFVYDGEKSGGSILLNLAKGTLRFVTGVAEKPAYLIRVPKASITVRGTIFDVFVEKSGASWLLLQEGAVRVCNDRGACRDHKERGKLIRISESGDLGKPSRWTSLPGIERISFDSAFPFVVVPPSIDPTPLFKRDDILEEIADEITPPKVRDRPDKQQEASKGDDDDNDDDGDERPRRPGKASDIDGDDLEAGRELIKGVGKLLERSRNAREGDGDDDRPNRRKTKLSSDDLKKLFRNPSKPN